MTNANTPPQTSSATRLTEHPEKGTGACSYKETEPSTDRSKQHEAKNTGKVESQPASTSEANNADNTGEDCAHFFHSSIGVESAATRQGVSGTIPHIPSPETNADMPADVVELVCAAREFWDANNDASPESTALDKALEAFASRVRYANEPDDIVDVRVAFGLEAQGHIPAVEAALAEGADWQDIGCRIGWDGETAKTYYERHLARLATTEGQP